MEICRFQCEQDGRLDRSIGERGWKESFCKSMMGRDMRVGPVNACNQLLFFGIWVKKDYTSQRPMIIDVRVQRLVPVRHGSHFPRLPNLV